MSNEKRKHSRYRRLVILAVVLHLVTTLSVFLLGRQGVIPRAIDTRGIAISFASDGVRYQQEATILVETLRRDGIRSWLAARYQFHVKLYSLSYAIFGPLVGLNILAAEPLNLFFYLAILFLIFKLAEELFNTQIALLSVIVVGLWPSFLLHTTQLLRDPLFLALWLGLILIFVRQLIRSFDWSEAVASAILAVIIGFGLWVVRFEVWILILPAALLVTVFVIVRQIRERRLLLPNLLISACLLGITGLVRIAPPISTRVQRQQSIVAKLWQPIASRRTISITTGNYGTSDIDTHIMFESAADVVRYLPRAFVVGTLAPFPQSWFEEGTLLGRTGRLLSGGETLLIYLVELTALFALWRRRRQLVSWFLFLVTFGGMTALGLVVVNVGTLYRLRYPFLLLLIIPAIAGVSDLISLRTEKKVAAPVKNGDVLAERLSGRSR